MEDVFGILFAPSGFYIADLSNIDCGIIPLERLEALFHGKYNSTLVIEILSELMLGKVLEEGIQIPALLKVNMKAKYWVPDKSYILYTGWRIECVDETDIFSPSFFPKLQVNLMNAKEGRITLWAQGLMFIENRIQIIVYMGAVNKVVDIFIRGEEGCEKECYEAREQLRETVKCELHNSSSGTHFTELVIRPADISEFKPEMITYDYNYLQWQEELGIDIISQDGRHRDSLQELLYCNCVLLPDAIIEGKIVNLSFILSK